MTDKSSDEDAFGEGAWIYCSQHLRPHQTGWCTVSNEDKTALVAKSYFEAIRECKNKGLLLWGKESGWGVDRV